MCDCKRMRAHNFVDRFCLQTTPTTRRCCDIDHHHDVCCPVSHARRYADEMSYSRRSPSLRWISLWVTTTIAVESPTDLFVASHWLERFASRFSVTLLVFIRADHCTSQVLTAFYVVFISTFYWRLASKDLQLIRPLSDWSTAMTSHAAVNDARSIQISKYLDMLLSKHASCCSAIRPNYQSQPQ